MAYYGASPSPDHSWPVPSPARSPLDSRAGLVPEIGRRDVRRTDGRWRLASEFDWMESSLCTLSSFHFHISGSVFISTCKTVALFDLNFIRVTMTSTTYLFVIVIDIFVRLALAEAHLWTWGLSLPLIKTKDSGEPAETAFDASSTDGRTDSEPQGFCLSNKQCGRGRYCDVHFGKCERLRRQGELCRKDYHCQRKHECVFGRCRREVPKGHEGARCLNDSECPGDSCCARQHGEMVCKARLKLAMKCFVPAGGLDYSLNEQCPCETGLICQYEPLKANVHSPSSRASDKEWFQISTESQQMKCLPAA